MPHVVLSNANVEALKWIALVLMTLDHINTFLYEGRFPALFKLGRIAMPLFGFVLAYNLARAGVLESGVVRRMMKRLAVFGVLASPAFIALIGRRLPLNIMFALLVAAAVIALLQQDGPLRLAAALILLCAGGTVVEFKWFGLVYCVVAWLYCKRPGWLTLSIWAAAAVSLYAINHNLWALAALPLIFIVARIDLGAPRLRYLFYVYYPAHLHLIWLLAKIGVPAAIAALW